MDSYGVTSQQKCSGLGYEFVYRYHKGQLRLNMSCDALRIDDQATGHIVLESEKVTLAGFMEISRRSISQDLCR